MAQGPQFPLPPSPPGPPAPAQPQWPAHPAYPAPVVARKHPTVSLLCSLFVPGVGQMVNGETGKGVLMLAGWIVCWLLFLTLVTILIAIGIWVWAMVDAYRGAERWNVAHGLPR